MSAFTRTRSRVVAIAGLVAVLMAGSSIPASASSQLFRENGWHGLATTDRRAAATLIDRSPARTRALVLVQRRAGASGKCVARINMLKGPHTFVWKVTRRAGQATWVSNRQLRSPAKRDRTIRTLIKTNGNCVAIASVR